MRCADLKYKYLNTGEVTEVIITDAEDNILNNNHVLEKGHTYIVYIHYCNTAINNEMNNRLNNMEWEECQHCKLETEFPDEIESSDDSEYDIEYTGNNNLILVSKYL